MTITVHCRPFAGLIKNLSSKSLRAAGIFVAASAVLPYSLAQAQTAENIYPESPGSGGFVGAGIASLPKYQGSDHAKKQAVLLLEYHWSNGLFVGGENDALIGVQRSATSSVQYGAALGVDEGRRESRSSALAGMGNVSTKPVLVSFVKAAVTEQLSLSASAHFGSGNEKKGALMKLGAAYAIPLNSFAQISFNVGATLANDSYMENYFGVSSAQSNASHYRPYTASSGVRDINFGARLFYLIDQDWSVLAAVSNTNYGNAAKDSPLVKTSSGAKFLFGIAHSIK